jgi:hypothetical protein
VATARVHSADRAEIFILVVTGRRSLPRRFTNRYLQSRGANNACFATKPGDLKLVRPWAGTTRPGMSFHFARECALYVMARAAQWPERPVKSAFLLPF